MKAVPVKYISYEPQGGGNFKRCPIEEATHVRLHLPGPISNRLIPFILKGNREDYEEIVWTWNGDTERPTLRPSVRTRTRRGGEEIVCHTWINDGQAIFHNDCTHELKGQTLDLLDADEPIDEES